MTAAKIDRKIARAFGKVGKKLGYQFNIYRPDSYVTPLADRNLLLTAPISWSIDDAFKTNPEPDLDYFTIYCNYTVLQPGDILFSEEAGRTFIVTEITPIRGAVGVSASYRMDILRPVHTPTADIKVSFDEVVKDMPCAFEFQGAAGNDVALTTVNSSMATGQSQIEVWTWLPLGTVKMSDVLQFNSDRYIVTSLEASGSGFKIKAKSTRAGR